MNRKQLAFWMLIGKLWLLLAELYAPANGAEPCKQIIHSHRDDRIVLPMPGYEAPSKGVPGRDGKDGKDGRDGLPGKDGVDGKPGRDGIDGRDGKDGVSPSIDAIVAAVLPKIPPAEQPDLAAIVAAVIAQLPPTTFVVIGRDGAVVSETKVPVGGRYELQPIFFEQYNVDGKFVDGDTIPLGGTLRIKEKLIIIDAKAKPPAATK